MLDGVYLNRDGVPVFHEAAAPSAAELEAVLLQIITRTIRILTRLGAVIEEPEGTYLAETDTDGAKSATLKGSYSTKTASMLSMSSAVAQPIVHSSRDILETLARCEGRGDVLTTIGAIENHQPSGIAGDDLCEYPCGSAYLILSAFVGDEAIEYLLPDALIRRSQGTGMLSFFDGGEAMPECILITWRSASAFDSAFACNACQWSSRESSRTQGSFSFILSEGFSFVYCALLRTFYRDIIETSRSKRLKRHNFFCVTG